ncbi:MAG: hypothetical protein WDA21_00465 [Bacilli bacterium]
MSKKNILLFSEIIRRMKTIDVFYLSEEEKIIYQDLLIKTIGNGNQKEIKNILDEIEILNILHKIDIENALDPIEMARTIMPFVEQILEEGIKGYNKGSKVYKALQNKANQTIEQAYQK